MYRCVLFSLFAACTVQTAPVGVPGQAAPVSGSSHSWGWSTLGTEIGAAGMFAAHDGQSPVLVSTTGNSWVMMQDDGREGLTQTYASFPSNMSIRGIAVGNLAMAPGDELAILREDSTIEVWSLAAPTRLGTFMTGERDGRAVALGDIDGDGIDEIVLSNSGLFRSGDVVVYSATGTEQARYAGLGGYSIIVGDLDADATLEAVSSAGIVLDLSTGLVEWDASAHFSEVLELVDGTLAMGDVNGDGRADLLAVHAQGSIEAFDVTQRQLLWTLPEEGKQVQIADADGDGAPELLVGGAPFMAVQAYTLPDLDESWTLQSTDDAVDALAVADLDGDNAPEVYWSAGGAHSGPDRLSRGDALEERTTWQRTSRSSYLHAPVLADLDGDGLHEIIMAERAASDSVKLQVLDGRSKQMLTSVDVFPGAFYSSLGMPVARDLDRDGTDELILAGKAGTRGMLEIWSLDQGELVQRMSTSRGLSDGLIAAAVVDLFGDGTLDIVVGGESDHLQAFDLEGSITWTSEVIGPVASLKTGLLDRDARPEIVALDDNGDVTIIDGRTGRIDGQIPGPWVDLELFTNPQRSLMLLDEAGTLAIWSDRRGGYTQQLAHTMPGVGEAIAMSVPFPGVVMVAHDGMAEAMSVPGLQTLWQTQQGVEGIGRETAYLRSTGELLISTEIGVLGFRM